MACPRSQAYCDTTVSRRKQWPALSGTLLYDTMVIRPAVPGVGIAGIETVLFQFTTVLLFLPLALIRIRFSWEILF